MNGKSFYAGFYMADWQHWECDIKFLIRQCGRRNKKL